MQVRDVKHPATPKIRCKAFTHFTFEIVDQDWPKVLLKGLIIELFH